MTDRKKKRLIADLFLVLVLIPADRYSKVLAVRYLRGSETVILIRGFLELLYVENYGAAFGMFRNMRVFFIVIALIILAGIVYTLIKLPDDRRYCYLHPVLTVLAAGAAGNLIDRVMTVYVVDFIYVSLIHFPVFNLADIYVTLSAATLFLLVMRYYRDEDFAFLRRGQGTTQNIQPTGEKTDVHTRAKKDGDT